MRESLKTLGITAPELTSITMLNPEEYIPGDIDPKQKKKVDALKNIIRLYTESKPEGKTVIKKPQDVYALLKNRLSGLRHEELHAVFMRKNNSVIDTMMISKGGIDSTTMDVKVIAREALMRHAVSVAIAHNHPSGDVKPSEADLLYTKKLNSALKTMEIGLLDHIIVAQGRYFSFAQEKTFK